MENIQDPEVNILLTQTQANTRTIPFSALENECL